MRTKRIDLDILNPFKEAAKDLLNIYNEQQRFKELRRASRKFYQEQKARTLEEFNQFEFLFSDSYRHLREGCRESIPNLGDLDVSTILKTCIKSGLAFEETYQEIERSFDQRIREAGTINRKDPSGSLKNIKRFEKKILPLLDNFKDRVKSELNNAMDLSTVSSKLSSIANDTLLWPGRAIIEEEIPDAYRLGDNFGTIQLNAATKRKKKEAYSDFIKPKPERQLDWKKIADIIERTIGDFEGISDEVNKRIRKAIADGVINETSYLDIVESVLDVVESVGVNRAKAMVHYEIQAAVNKGIEQRYKDAGVEKLEWLACEDEHTCDYCSSMDGQQFPTDNHPDCPADPFCRCTWVPVIKIPGDDEEE